MQLNFKSIKETCIYTQDMEKARHFYHEVLGLPIIGNVPDKHIFFRAGDSVLLVFNPLDSAAKISPPPHAASGKQHFAFEVPAAEYERSKESMTKLGITITDEVTWKSGKKSFYFEDPDGNVLEILPDSGVWD